MRKDLNQDWEAFYRVGTTETLLRHAAGLAERFALRAYDSVHLAADQSLQVLSGPSMQFGCFDRSLTAAAAELGLLIASRKQSDGTYPFT